MPQVIDTPDGLTEFPDEMSGDEIQAVLDKQYGVTFDKDIPVLAPQEDITAEQTRLQSLEIPGIDSEIPLAEAKETPYRMAAITAGAMGGAELGRRAAESLGPYSRISQPMGALAGGAIGAAFGAFEYDVSTGTPPVDAILSALKEGELDIKYGLGIPGAARVVRAIGASGARAIGITAEHTAQLAKTAEEIGAKYGLVDAANWAPIRGIKTVLGVFPFVGTPFRKSGKQSQEAVMGAMDEYLNRVAPNASLAQAGIDMVEAAGKSFEEFRTVGGALFENADELAKAMDATVPNKAIIEAANSAVTRLDLPKLTEGALPDTGGNQITEFIEGLTKLEGESMTISEVRALEKSLSELYVPQNITGTDARRIMKVKEAIEGAWADVSTQIEGGDAQIRAAYNQAKSFWSHGMTIFETTTASKIGRVDKTIFKAKAFKAGSLDEDEVARFAFNLRSAKSVKDLKALVGRGPVLDAWRANMDDAIEKSFKELPDGTGFSFNFSHLEQQLGMTGNKVASGALTEVLKDTGVSAKQFKNLIELGKSLGDIPMASRFVARRAVMGGAGSALRAATGMGVGAAMGAVSIPGAIGITVLTRMGANALTKPKYVNALIRVLDPGVSTIVRNAQAARLIRYMLDDEADSENMINTAAEL